MHGPFRYRAHGFSIESEYALPGLLPSDEEADVVIARGTPPRHLDGPVTRGPGYEAVRGQFLLDLPGVARYWVCDGCRVLIEPAPGATDEAVRVFIMSSVMAALAHQRGRLALHASAIETAGGYVLFAGASGAGKSTIVAAFHARGYRVLSDDVSVVSFDPDGKPAVHQGYTHVKLRTDSLRQIRGSLEDAPPRWAATSKFLVRIGEPEGSSPQQALPIARIYVLAPHDGDAVVLTPIEGGAKVTTLVRYTYRRRMLMALGGREAHFNQCTAVAARVAMTRLERPRDLGGIEGLTRTLEADFRPAGAVS
jgi:hypothetical protein